MAEAKSCYTVRTLRRIYIVILWILADKFWNIWMRALIIFGLENSVARIERSELINFDICFIKE